MLDTSQEIRVRPLEEQWPNLRFLGLGAWWAWIWLCFSSTVVTGLFPVDVRSEYVLWMYLISTPAIATCMAIAAALYRKIEPLAGRKSLGYAFGGMASIATLLLLAAGSAESFGVFVFASVLSGVGTSYLCLSVGKLYGGVGLGESLTAGALSLVFASLLYFVGVALPGNGGALFAALLPLLSAGLLCMRADDAFTPLGGAVRSSEEEANASKRAFRRLVAAAAVVAFSAGVGKGISSLLSQGSVFTEQGIVCTFTIGVIGTLILFAVNKRGAVFGTSSAYTVLILFGVAVSLASCVGIDIAYLAIGKEVLWLIFSLLMAYIAFRYSLSAVRVFGIGQAAYFLCSFAGWLVGYAVTPYYGEQAAMLAVGLSLAFAVVLTALVILPVGAIVDIVKTAMPGRASLAGDVSSNDIQAACGGSENTVPAASIQDGRQWAQIPSSPYGRAADPVYGLSKRELEIMALFAQGRSANWIAENQCISKNTVRTHLRSVYAKLDVHTRQELLDLIAGKPTNP